MKKNESTENESKVDYALEGQTGAPRIAAPVLDYKPPRPHTYRPRIGLIGCGGITESHLKACRWHGFPVVVFCDCDEGKADKRRGEFYPKASVYTRYQHVLQDDEIDLVDIATHPREREPIIEEAIAAGKHILSQKPFVLDLDYGQRLADAADRAGVRLAVNHNGRWAPHFSYMRQAIRQGDIGDVVSIDMSVHWDHNFVRSLPFNNIPHLILYDFGIHWFDIMHCFLGDRTPKLVTAFTAHAKGQQARPPLLANVVVEYPDAMVTIILNGNTPSGAEDRTIIVGTKGTLKSIGPNIGKQAVTLHTAQGVARPRLKGSWFTNGFRGTIGELACAVEENREPENSARSSLKGLRTAFAAIQSAESGRSVNPQTVTKARPEWLSFPVNDEKQT